MQIKQITEKDRPKALALVWATFLEYEAPDYSKEGVDNFWNFVINNNEYIDSIVMYGAYEGEDLRGVIATRKNGTHISLFFVDGKYQRQGIGKKLFQTVLEKCTSDTMTVNSSPYAMAIYHHLGFLDIDSQQIKDGIIYTPMEYKK